MYKKTLKFLLIEDEVQPFSILIVWFKSSVLVYTVK